MNFLVVDANSSSKLMMSCLFLFTQINQKKETPRRIEMQEINDMLRDQIQTKDSDFEVPTEIG